MEEDTGDHQGSGGHWEEGQWMQCLNKQSQDSAAWGIHRYSLAKPHSAVQFVFERESELSPQLHLNLIQIRIATYKTLQHHQSLEMQTFHFLGNAQWACQDLNSQPQGKTSNPVSHLPHKPKAKIWPSTYLRSCLKSVMKGIWPTTLTTHGKP